MDDDIDYHPRAGKRAGRVVKQESEKGEYTKQMNLLVFTRNYIPHYVNQKDDTAHFWNEQGLKAVFYLRKNFWTVSDKVKRIYGTAEQFLTWWHSRQTSTEPAESAEIVAPSKVDTRQRIKELREIANGKSVKESA